MRPSDATIVRYLHDLRTALRGADKAVVQDALADAEEHFRTALEQERGGSGGQSDGEVLDRIIRDYGSPEEVAEAYRSWEQNLPPALAQSSAVHAYAAASRRRRRPGFFGVYADPLAWGGLVFMLISLVTGTLYFSWAVAGLSTSLGVMILIIGIPVTILFLLSVRGITFLEGRLVEGLLGERMPRRPSFTDSSLGWIERLKHLLTGRQTWLGLLYMVLMLPLGVIYFSVAVTLLALALAFVATPVATIIFDLPVVSVGGRGVYALPDGLALLVPVVGVVVATVTLHLSRWVGGLHGKLAKALLVSE